MLMDYWSPQRLNHHTEASSMLYAARECARLVLQEGLDACFDRHTLASQAITTGLQALGLELFGDQRHKMANVTGIVIPPGVNGDAIRHSLLQDFGIEIGTSFGPLHGRIWRIGAMDTPAASRISCTVLALSKPRCGSRGFNSIPARPSMPRCKFIAMPTRESAPLAIGKLKQTRRQHLGSGCEVCWVRIFNLVVTNPFFARDKQHPGRTNCG